MDEKWCEECAAPWWERPFRAESDAPRLDVHGRVALPTWSIVPLEGPAHRMVTAWKDGGRRDLDPFFTDAATRAARVLSAALARADAVVPVPSRPRSVRARGVDLTSELARAVAQGLGDARDPVPVERPLINRGSESRLLGDRGRWANAAGGIAAGRERCIARAVVLVDDVVTTGASLARAADVLEGLGVVAIGALTLAATPRRRPGTSLPVAGFP